MGYFKKVQVLEEAIMAPLSNSIVFCSAITNFGKRIEFDKLSPKSPKNIYKNDITGEL